MRVYIQGIGNISIQNTFKHIGFPEPVWYNESYIRCIDPNFSEFISPIEARRMSRVIKRAIASAKASIADSGIDMPDAVISGTGLGCIEDTEKFLSAMIENDEKYLQPTYFIQSTHNTISSQIAINLKCYGHNNTFVHGGISFECALAEALLLFDDNHIKTALVGGYDEMTPSYFKILNRVGMWKKQADANAVMSDKTIHGSFAGEGSVSVMLSNEKSKKSYAAIDALELIYQPDNPEASVESFLSLNQKKAGDIDLIVCGMNSDEQNDNIYKKITDTLFEKKALACYKNLCGDYYTSTGFGLWFAANCIQQKNVPSYSSLNNNNAGRLQNVLLLNHYQNKDFSLILLSAC